ncbi:hypothetical protein [Streptomyces mirabilis]|uniref:hypothetical protein n=1 Tax=Streptomyces mirabilis TaxID=68239 RepID=UPI0033279BFC
MRAHVQAALGGLKLATADQMHRLMAPGHKDNKAFRNAALDLARHGLAVSEGSTRAGKKLWNLTPLGLDAAAEVLDRPVGDGRDRAWCGPFGCPACDGGQRDGHRLTRTPATATRPAPRQQPASTPTATEQAPAPGLGLETPGMGWIGSWSTEVPLNLPTSRGNRAGVRADAVLQAPEAGLPVLFVEVDNCTRYGFEERDGYYGYADAIPLLFTTLDRLQTSAPAKRCGGGADTASGKPSPTPSPLEPYRRVSGADCRSPALPARTPSSPRPRTDGTVPPAAPASASTRPCAKPSSDAASAASSPAPPER